MAKAVTAARLVMRALQKNAVIHSGEADDRVVIAACEQTLPHRSAKAASATQQIRPRISHTVMMTPSVEVCERAYVWLPPAARYDGQRRCRVRGSEAQFFSEPSGSLEDHNAGH